MTRRVLLAAALLAAAGYVFVYATGRADPPVRSDGFSYYVYLPSWFLYNDASLSALLRNRAFAEALRRAEFRDLLSRRGMAAALAGDTMMRALRDRNFEAAIRGQRFAADLARKK